MNTGSQSLVRFAGAIVQRFQRKWLRRFGTQAARLCCEPGLWNVTALRQFVTIQWIKRLVAFDRSDDNPRGKTSEDAFARQQDLRRRNDQEEYFVHRKAFKPIRQAGDREHEKPLTQTVRVSSGDSVPPGYRRFPVKSPAIYAKVQVLSSKLGMPVFIETPSVHSEHRIAYWVHEDILPELARWLRVRIFPISEIVDRDG